MEATAGALSLAVLHSVRCLECGEIYSKPSAGGTVHKNPGCPSCGYVGWIPVSLPPEEQRALRRSGEDRQPLRSARES
jgi:predicted  nucleic acid-binding Zn-ribbon protein